MRRTVLTAITMCFSIAFATSGGEGGRDEDDEFLQFLAAMEKEGYITSSGDTGTSRVSSSYSSTGPSSSMRSSSSTGPSSSTTHSSISIQPTTSRPSSNLDLSQGKFLPPKRDTKANLIEAAIRKEAARRGEPQSSGSDNLSRNLEALEKLQDREDARCRAYSERVRTRTFSGRHLMTAEEKLAMDKQEEMTNRAFEAIEKIMVERWGYPGSKTSTAGSNLSSTGGSKPVPIVGSKRSSTADVASSSTMSSNPPSTTGSKRSSTADVTSSSTMSSKPIPIVGSSSSSTAGSKTIPSLKTPSTTSSSYSSTGNNISSSMTGSKRSSTGDLKSSSSTGDLKSAAGSSTRTQPTRPPTRSAPLNPEFQQFLHDLITRELNSTPGTKKRVPTNFQQSLQKMLEERPPSVQEIPPKRVPEKHSNPSTTADTRADHDPRPSKRPKSAYGPMVGDMMDDAGDIVLDYFKDQDGDMDSFLDSIFGANDRANSKESKEVHRSATRDDPDASIIDASLSSFRPTIVPTGISTTETSTSPISTSTIPRMHASSSSVSTGISQPCENEIDKTSLLSTSVVLGAFRVAADAFSELNKDASDKDSVIIANEAFYLSEIQSIKLRTFVRFMTVYISVASKLTHPKSAQEVKCLFETVMKKSSPTGDAVPNSNDLRYFFTLVCTPSWSEDLKAEVASIIDSEELSRGRSALPPSEEDQKKIEVSKLGKAYGLFVGKNQTSINDSTYYRVLDVLSTEQAKSVIFKKFRKGAKGDKALVTEFERMYNEFFHEGYYRAFLNLASNFESMLMKMGCAQPSVDSYKRVYQHKLREMSKFLFEKFYPFFNFIMMGDEERAKEESRMEYYKEALFRDTECRNPLALRTSRFAHEFIEATVCRLKTLCAFGEKHKDILPFGNEYVEGLSYTFITYTMALIKIDNFIFGLMALITDPSYCHAVLKSMEAALTEIVLSQIDPVKALRLTESMQLYVELEDLSEGMQKSIKDIMG